MATVNVTDTDSFTVAETIEDINGSASAKAQSELFSVTETEYVHVVGDFPYYPPFNVAFVSMIYTASFQGNRGYEDPTTFLHLTKGGVYPQINAQLFDITDDPLKLHTIAGQTIDFITFDVACDDGTFITRTVTIADADDGQVYFDWPSAAPVGTHPARFTLWDDQIIDVPLLSVPTWPLTVVIREAPHG